MQYRQDFPLLNIKENDESIVYLDNAATSQKPYQVLKTISDYYKVDNANIHRGVYELSERATSKYEQVRVKVANLINAKAYEIVFTRSTTESINWIARSYEQILKPNDEIVISYAEHHSNLVPWQNLAQLTGAKLKYIKLNKAGQIDLADASKVITDQTRIVSVAHVTNVLGSINPIKQLAKLAHKHHSVIVVDGAQAAGHMQVDVQALAVDYYAFSAHKMLGPTGVGVLWGRYKLLEKMTPIQFGGEMIEEVSLQSSTYKMPPLKFEAGTQNIAGVVGFGSAIDYLNQVGLNNISKIEQELMNYLVNELQKLPYVTIYGSKHETGILSFNLENIHPHDVATALDMQGICVRAGHHCAQVMMDQLGVNATVRVSVYFYNTRQDIDRLIKAIKTTEEYFNGTSKVR